MDDSGESSTSVELRTRTSHSPSLSLSLPSPRVSAAWARGEHAVDGRFLTRRGTSSRRPTSPTDSFIKPDGKWGRARRVGVNCRGRGENGCCMRVERGERLERSTEAYHVSPDTFLSYDNIRLHSSHIHR